jgi:hypothetical protein
LAQSGVEVKEGLINPSRVILNIYVDLESFYKLEGVGGSPWEKLLGGQWCTWQEAGFFLTKTEEFFLKVKSDKFGQMV